MLLVFTLSIILLIAAAVVFFYNSLVAKEKMLQEAFSGINVQLKRRHDLIPQLVETVKGYAKHEKSTLESVIAQRKICESTKSLDDKVAQENILSSMLKSVFALSEQYPDLKANQNFAELQSSLNHVEDEIQMSRRYYNATVRDFNILIDVFPVNLVAKKFNFTPKTYFEIENEEEAKPVQVKF